MEGKSKRQMDRWKERQEEGSSKIRKTVDSGILISTISKGVNILVKHFMGKETHLYSLFCNIVSTYSFYILGGMSVVMSAILYGLYESELFRGNFIW